MSNLQRGGESILARMMMVMMMMGSGDIYFRLWGRFKLGNYIQFD